MFLYRHWFIVWQLSEPLHASCPRDDDVYVPTRAISRTAIPQTLAGMVWRNNSSLILAIHTNPPYQVLIYCIYLEYTETKTNNTPLGLNLYSRII